MGHTYSSIASSQISTHITRSDISQSNKVPFA